MVRPLGRQQCLRTSFCTHLANFRVACRCEIYDEESWTENSSKLKAHISQPFICHLKWNCHEMRAWLWTIWRIFSFLWPHKHFLSFLFTGLPHLSSWYGSMSLVAEHIMNAFLLVVKPNSGGRPSCSPCLLNFRQPCPSTENPSIRWHF